MRWFYCKNENFVGLECVNNKTDKHLLRLSPNTKAIPTDEDIEGDIRYIAKFIDNKPTVKDVKKLLIAFQKEYDVSAEVNLFYLNGKRVWLDKATRVGLFNILNLEKQNNKENTTLWFKNNSININVDKAIKLLTAVEVYAKQCYDNTQKHYAEINNLNTIEDCLRYDITAGYPEILSIEA